MDFFQRQDHARRKSTLLIAYFVLAVATIALAMYLAACFIMPMLTPDTNSGDSSSARSIQSHEFSLWQPQLLLWVGGGTLLVIGLGSLYKIIELRGGGAMIANMLGGRLIQPNTNDPGERRLMNVIQEMALASGTPVPPVYVLDEEKGINAFAAGYTPADAVIGVNRGTIDYLSRDELQGVIAHEFSHILNGDMRTNIHLMGVLHGILLIAVIGFYALRFGGLSGGRSSSSKNNSGAYIMLLGVAALVIGAIGLVFARLIKATLSRQREYLADASAVQFTRNPEGISGALKKIGGLSGGSRVLSAEAESASHMFFGNARRESSFISFSTHPPLRDRIRRLDPSFEGKFPEVKPYREQPGSPPARKAGKKAASPSRSSPGGPMLGDRFPLTAAVALGAIGTPSEQHVAQSRELLEAIPAAIRNAVQEPFAARAAIYALLLDPAETVHAKQVQVIEKREGKQTAQQAVQLEADLKQLDDSHRLSVVDMAQSPLSQLSPDQYQVFRETITTLAHADEQISLFEFMLQRVLLERLDRQLLGSKPPPNKYRSLAAVKETACQLISVLAHAGSDQQQAAQRAYEGSLRQLYPKGNLPPLLDRNACSLHLVDNLLNHLAQSAPAIKKRLLEAAIACVAADGEVTIAEAELVRALAASLDCPLPPLRPGTLPTN